MDIDTLFAGMAGAAMNSKGTYMGEGLYLVVPKVVKVKEGFKGRSFIHEFEILESNNPAHGVGSTGSWVVKLDKPQAWGDIKSLIFALVMDIDPKTVKDATSSPEALALHNRATEITKAAVSPEHAAKLGFEPDFLIGMPVKLECIKVKTTKGGDFTVHNWSPAPEAAA